jgi:hypothetical protein
MRIDVTHFERDVNNFADDDVLLNTGVSFPIAFRQARITGTEVKVELPLWRAVSGSLSYANMTGIGHLPVTGGLLLGDNATISLNASDQFPVTQDQRHTLRGRASLRLAPRAWVALVASYGSGLPVVFSGTSDQAVAQYGQRIVGRVDFASGRVRPNFSLDASTGFDIVKPGGPHSGSLQLQIDALNLTNRLNVIDFAGLFSGTALAPPRGFAIRLQAGF